MTNKAKKRRRELAAKLDVSRRTAANIIRSRVAERRPSDTDPEADFFGIIAGAIRKAYPNAALNFVDEDKRLEVRLATHYFAFLTPRNAKPTWPVMAWNETGRVIPAEEGTRAGRRLHRRHDYEWECETIQDILTVLRWPDVLPSGPYASVNEIRDDHENPSKHVWVRARHDHPQPEPLTTTYECDACRAKLYVHFGETVEEVARMGYENWRQREARTLAANAARTLTRSMGVGFIPPTCSGTRQIPNSETDSADDAVAAARRAIPHVRDAIKNLAASAKPLAGIWPLAHQITELRPQTQMEHATKPLADIAAITRPIEAIKALTATPAAEMMRPLSITSAAEALRGTSLKSAIEKLHPPGLKSALDALKPVAIESAAMQGARMTARLTGEDTAVMKAIRMEERLAAPFTRLTPEADSEDEA